MWTLVSSYYVVEEARRNLLEVRPEAVSELEVLVSKMNISSGISVIAETFEHVNLHINDKPVLSAAIEMRASHLLTGNTCHFEHLFGRNVAGVTIQTPAMYQYERRNRRNSC